AEDGRRGADAERERDHGSYGEPGIAGEAARRIRDVAPQIVQPEERRASHLCYLYNTDVIKIACREQEPRVTCALTPDILTRRERQIMDVLYRRGHATAREVTSEMGGKQAYSTVRT